MPEGWRTVSVPEDIYNYLVEKWEKNKKEYKIRFGVSSFAGFVGRILYRLSEDEQHIRNSEASSFADPRPSL